MKQTPQDGRRLRKIPFRAARAWHHTVESGLTDVVRLGLPRSALKDYYHQALTVSWSLFFYGACAFFLAINTVFALLYMWAPCQISNLQPMHFLGAFYFSVQTLSTVGYGQMAPTGPYANTIVVIEVFLGMILNALSTGLVFARFSRPSAKLRFAKHLLISQQASMLSMRIANLRNTGLLAVDVQFTLSSLHMLGNGHTVRKFVDLPLLQAHFSTLRYSFVLSHMIDAQSPLHGLTPEQLKAQDVELIVTVSGTDEVTSQTTCSRAVYRSDQVIYGHCFVDIVEGDANGRVIINFAHFEDTLPDHAEESED